MYIIKYINQFPPFIHSFWFDCQLVHDAEYVNFDLILTPRRSNSHVPTFSKKHPMIPKLYVMPWKQDMKNQKHLMKVKKKGI